jgi:hypothetical protein
MVTFYMKAYRCEKGTATRRVRAKLQALLAEETNGDFLKMPSYPLPVDFGPPRPDLI